MSSFLSHMMFAYLALFPILNPPAMAPVFLQLTASVDEGQRNRHLREDCHVVLRQLSARANFRISSTLRSRSISW